MKEDAGYPSYFNYFEPDLKVPTSAVHPSLISRSKKCWFAFGFSYYLIFAVLFFVGMGAALVPRPMFGLWGRLGFWFGLFFGLFWDGWGGFCSRALCWLYVGWDGTRMGNTLRLRKKWLDKAYMFYLLACRCSAG